jgi:dTDP-glucose pyrophosphorylase
MHTAQPPVRALILAGGRGQRLGGRTRERNKCLLEFAGRPLIAYSLERCLALAPSEIVVVVGYLGEQIIERFGTEFGGAPLRYVIQAEQHGLVHAIETAAPRLHGAPFMLFLADEILLAPRHQAMLERFWSSEAVALCGVTRPRDPEAVRNTYALLEDQQGRVLRLVEKPRHALTPWQGTGNILFHPAMLDYLATTPIHPARQERELPDWIQCAIDDGRRVESFEVGGDYININRPEDIGAAEAAVAARATAAAGGR